MYAVHPPHPQIHNHESKILFFIQNWLNLWIWKPGYMEDQLFIYWKNLHISGPLQFKPILFKATKTASYLWIHPSINICLMIIAGIPLSTSPLQWAWFWTFQKKNTRGTLQDTKAPPQFLRPGGASLSPVWLPVPGLLSLPSACPVTADHLRMHDQPLTFSAIQWDELLYLSPKIWTPSKFVFLSTSPQP